MLCGEIMTLYICDRKQCRNCIPYCHHTPCRKHARDRENAFKTDREGHQWEKPKPGDNWRLDTGGE